MVRARRAVCSRGNSRKIKKNTYYSRSGRWGSWMCVREVSSRPTAEKVGEEGRDRRR